MRKLIFAISVAAIAALTSCSEWEPVVNVNYDDVEVATPVTLDVNCTIAQLKAMYKKIGEPIWNYP